MKNNSPKIEILEQFAELKTILVNAIDDCPESMDWAEELLFHLLFLRFLEKRKVILPNFLKQLFQQAISEKADVYTTYLSPLFYKVVNNPIYLRTKEIENNFGNIPCLCGSLFDLMNKKEIERKKELFKQTRIKNIIWEQIVTFLYDNNWTFENISLGENRNNPDILGDLYESSLSQKKTGSFYTPKKVAQYITQNTISAYLTSQINIQFRTTYTDVVSELLKKKALDAQEIAQIQSLFSELLPTMHICDNSCGSGEFLIAAFRFIIELIGYGVDSKEITRLLPAKPEWFALYTTDRFKLKCKILFSNIFGVDLQIGAVRTTKFRLWLECLENSENPTYTEQELFPRLDFNILHGDGLIGMISPPTEMNPTELNVLLQYQNLVQTIRSNGNTTFQEKDFTNLILLKKQLEKAYNEQIVALIQESNNNLTLAELENLNPCHWDLNFPHIFENKGFEIIIGNPPYGQNIIQGLARTLIQKIWNPQSLGKKDDGKTYNPSAPFIERSYDLLNPRGQLGYIINNSIARVEEFEAIRKFLLNQECIRMITDEGNPFKESNVTLEMLCLFLQKTPIKFEKIRVKNHRTTNKTDFLIPIQWWKDYNRLVLYADDIFSWIYSHSEINILHGTRGRDAERLKSNKDTDAIPYLFSGKTVKKYRIDKKYMNYSSKSILNKPTWNNEYELEHILITTKIANKYRVMIKPRRCIIGNNVIKLSYNQPKLNSYMLLGLLNSSLMDYIVKKYIINFSELTTAFYDSITCFTPIRIPSQQQPFQILSRYILFLSLIENTELMAKFQHWLDYLIFELYFQEKFTADGIITKQNGTVAEKFQSILQPIDEKKIEELLTTIFEQKTETDYKEDLSMMERVANRIESDLSGQKIFKKIDQHPWVKQIQTEMY